MINDHKLNQTSARKIGKPNTQNNCKDPATNYHHHHLHIRLYSRYTLLLVESQVNDCTVNEKPSSSTHTQIPFGLWTGTLGLCQAPHAPTQCNLHSLPRGVQFGRPARPFCRIGRQKCRFGWKKIWYRAAKRRTNAGRTIVHRFRMNACQATGRCVPGVSHGCGSMSTRRWGGVMRWRRGGRDVRSGSSKNLTTVGWRWEGWGCCWWYVVCYAKIARDRVSCEMSTIE